MLAPRMEITPAQIPIAANKKSLLRHEHDLCRQRRSKVRQIAGREKRGKRQLGEAGSVPLAPDGNDEPSALAQ